MQTIENSSYTVLVVDDDIGLSNLWQEALSGVGFTVLTSSSGLKGLDTIRYASKKVDVVLLDYNMPTLDGSKTLEHLKDQFPDVKTIGVTGIDASRLPDTFRNGVEHLLLKPINITELVGSIHTVLGIEAESEAGKHKTNWVRFGVWYALLLLASYEFLRILCRVASETLLPH